MRKKDKKGMSKEGSGRVAMFRVSNSSMPHCYTMECNYFKGKGMNVLYPTCGEVMYKKRGLSRKGKRGGQTPSLTKK